MKLDNAYTERVYAGLLGKLIGVYMGRPTEGWTHQRILCELGEVNYFLHERFGHALVVCDDDISGTLVFLRALPDSGNSPNLDATQVGRAWLNYIVEGKTTLWWGGRGNSTEHTAYLNLKSGIRPPESGSAATNGALVSQQVGAQIFVDGWAMVAPGQPDLAAHLAEQSARVSHDGEAVEAARLLAAVGAQAFIEPEVQTLLEVGLSHVRKDSLIANVVRDVRTWASHDNDWYATRARIEEAYGYHRFGGGCHVVPNHAIVILSLIYSNDDFGRALTIANTSGWDTDCNSGNVGCIMGIRGGLPAIETGLDWRGPVADRLFVSSADGSRGITDAVQESIRIANIGRALAGQPVALAPKYGARFNFELPGSVQGFLPDNPNRVVVRNTSGHSCSGTRSLAIDCQPSPSRTYIHVSTATFIPPEHLEGSLYRLAASPTLYPGQVLSGRLESDSTNASSIIVRPFIRAYDGEDGVATTYGRSGRVQSGCGRSFEWVIPQTQGGPIMEVGIALRPSENVGATAYLDYLTWDGVPNTILRRPAGAGRAWMRAWVDAIDHVDTRSQPSFRISQDCGRGALVLGGNWQDVEVRADLETPLAKSIGVAIHVQGLERYYAFLMSDCSKVRLIARFGKDRVLAEKALTWAFGQQYRVELAASSNRVRVQLDGERVFDVDVAGLGFGPAEGGIALICEEGTMITDSVTIAPLHRDNRV